MDFNITNQVNLINYWSIQYDISEKIKIIENDSNKIYCLTDKLKFLLSTLYGSKGTLAEYELFVKKILCRSTLNQATIKETNWWSIALHKL